MPMLKLEAFSAEGPGPLAPALDGRGECAPESGQAVDERIRTVRKA